jgi:hypothetical protein
LCFLPTGNFAFRLNLREAATCDVAHNALFLL